MNKDYDTTKGAHRLLQVYLGLVDVIRELEEQVGELHACASLGQREDVHVTLIADGFVTFDCLQGAVVRSELPRQVHQRVELLLRVIARGLSRSHRSDHANLVVDRVHWVHARPGDWKVCGSGESVGEGGFLHFL